MSSSFSSNTDLILGIDIGTSSIKLVLMNAITSKIHYEANKSTINCKLKSNYNFDEQDVNGIIKSLNELLLNIPADFINRLKAVQFCGQMHGVVMWNSQTGHHSSLVTWQDARCNQEFLSHLPVKSISELKSGFGCATLFWYQLNDHASLNNYDMAGTIHDYLTYLFSGMNVMSNQNALSWGYFDMDSNTWQHALMVSNNPFPVKLLPNVVDLGRPIRNSICYKSNELSLVNDFTEIHTALGDLQCLVYSCLEKDDDCVINISTSSQICMCVDIEKFKTLRSSLPSSIAIFPYFNNKVLLVSASLNGGNVLQNFIEMIHDFGLHAFMTSAPSQTRKESLDVLWNKVLDLAKQDVDDDDSLKLEFKPLLNGERHDPTTYGSMQNITTNNFSIIKIFKSFCHGLVDNLFDMFTVDLLVNKLKCKRIIGTGSCLIKNEILMNYLSDKVRLVVNENDSILFKKTSDSAIGAALYLKHLYSN